MAKPSWVTLDKSSGTGDGSVKVTASQNSGSERSGVITVRTASGITKSVSVSQEKATTFNVNFIFQNFKIANSTTTTITLVLFAGYESAIGTQILNGLVCPPKQDTIVNRTISNIKIPFENINQFGISGNLPSGQTIISSEMSIISERGNMTAMSMFQGGASYKFVNYDDGAYIILKNDMDITFKNANNRSAIAFN